MTFYRNNFAESVIPKMHILENHVIPFIKKWHVRTGLMAEQGIESIHASINSITQKYKGIRNKEKQLLYIIKEHHLLVSPLNKENVPVPTRRKGDK